MAAFGHRVPGKNAPQLFNIVEHPVLAVGGELYDAIEGDVVVVAACRSAAAGAAVDADDVALFVHGERTLRRPELPESYICNAKETLRQAQGERIKAALPEFDVVRQITGAIGCAVLRFCSRESRPVLARALHGSAGRQRGLRRVV